MVRCFARGTNPYILIVLAMNFEEILSYYPHNKESYSELLGRCKSGYAVPYIGAGLSVFAGLPTWWRLLKTLQEECPDKSFSLSNPLLAANEIEKQLGDKFLDIVKQEFHYYDDNKWWRDTLTDRNAASQAISVIPKLFRGPIITSNYDKFIEAIHNFDIDVALPDDIEILNDTSQEIKHLIYKVHGCISKPESIILTGNSYDRYYESDSEHVKTLSTFFKRFNLVFLGCSLQLSEGKDRPIELWEHLVRSGQYHFAILPCERENCTKRYKELTKINIYPIFYPNSKHECVKTVLDRLVKDKNDGCEVPLFDDKKYPFVGRETMIKDISVNLNDKSKGNVLYLTGTGGFGKTRLACEYAIRTKLEYSSGTYFIHALSEDNIYAEMIRFAHSKSLLSHEDIKDRPAVYSIISKWMKEHDNWLFILDNVENNLHIKDIIELFSGEQPWGKRHFIITTRNKNSSKPHIQLKPFTKEESDALFFAVTQKEPDQYSARLTELLGGHPLAVEQAASYIANSKISYQACVSKILSKGLLKVINKGAHSDGTLAVKATYNLSMERIRKKETKQLMYLLSFFAPDDIEINWLLKSYRQISSFPSLQSRLKDPTSLKNMLDELASYSLIQKRDGMITVHRITQAVIRESILSKVWLDDSCQVMAYAFDNEDFDTVSAYSDFLRTVPHMEQMFKLYNANRSYEKTYSLGVLYHLFMHGFDRIKDHRVALRYLRNTIKIRKETCNSRDLGKTYNLIGVIYQNLGNHQESIKYLNKAISIRKKALIESSKEEKARDEMLLARTYNNVALHYYWTHNYKKAEDSLIKSIEIKEKHSDQEDTAFSYNNLGALYELMSQYYNSKAIEFNKKAYDIRKRGTNEVRIAFALNNLGLVEMNMGNLQDALIYLHKALELRERVHESNPTDTDIAETCINLGEAYTRLGLFSKAKKYIDKSVDFYVKRLTENHFATTTAFTIKAGWYYAQKQYNDALVWYEKVLEIRKAILEEGDMFIKETERRVDNCKKRLEGKSILD